MWLSVTTKLHFFHQKQKSEGQKLLFAPPMLSICTCHKPTNPRPAGKVLFLFAEMRSVADDTRQLFLDFHRVVHVFSVEALVDIIVIVVIASVIIVIVVVRSVPADIEIAVPNCALIHSSFSQN